MPSRLSALQELWLILRKDLTIELQGRVRTNATLFFRSFGHFTFQLCDGASVKASITSSRWFSLADDSDV